MKRRRKTGTKKQLHNATHDFKNVDGRLHESASIFYHIVGALSNIRIIIPQNATL